MSQIGLMNKQTNNDNISYNFDNLPVYFKVANI